MKPSSQSSWFIEAAGVLLFALAVGCLLVWT